MQNAHLRANHIQRCYPLYSLAVQWQMPYLLGCDALPEARYLRRRLERKTRSALVRRVSSTPCAFRVGFEWRIAPIRIGVC